MESEPLSISDRRREQATLFLLGALVAFSVICRLISAFVRTFNHDEFQVWYTAWMQSTGAVPGKDFYLPSYHLLVAFLEPLFRWFPESTTPIYISRAINAAGGLAILVLVYLIGRRLTESRVACLLAVVLVTFYTDFNDRIGDVRADTWNVLCVLVAIGSLVSGSGRRHSVLAGIAAGVAVVSRFKMGIAFPPLLLLGFLLYGRRWVVRGLEMVLASSIPIVLYLTFIAVFDSWAYFWETQRHLSEVITSSLVRFSPATEIAKSFGRNRAGVFLVVLGIGIAAPGLMTQDRRKRLAGTIALVSVVYILLYLVADPVFYQYNWVDLVPVLALTIPAAAATLDRRFDRLVPLFAGLFAIAIAIEGVPRTLRTARRSNAFQLRYLDYIRTAIRPDERVMDLQGTHLFRRGPFHWRLASVHMNLYRTQRWFSVPDELRRYQVSLIVLNYRFDWLPRSDKEFIARHYLPAGPFLLFPGWSFDSLETGVGVFEIVVPGNYRFRPSRPGGVKIDGAPAPDPVRLTVGDHLIEVNPGESVFELVYTTPEREAHRLEYRPGDQLLYLFD